MTESIIKILLVEDNEGDIVLITEALEEFKTPTQLQILRDGSEALFFLTDVVKQNAEALPDLILLDINLPKNNGHEVLASVKSHPEMKHIPVIILTTSSSETDILRAYQEHANCYITKPLEVNEFLIITAKIEDFWLNMVRLPKN